MKEQQRHRPRLDGHADLGENKSYVFGVSDADLNKVVATCIAQQFGAEVPEPSSIALVLTGLGMPTVGVRRRT